MARLVHFEIHADDPERAAKFYTSVFGWEITKWEMPVEGNFPGYWLIKTGEDSEPGINGGLLKRQGPPPQEGQAVNAFPCTVDVEDLDAFIAKAKENGGAVAADKMPVPGVGWLAYMKDTEGNIFGMMQSDKEAK